MLCTLTDRSTGNTFKDVPIKIFDNIMSCTCVLISVSKSKAFKQSIIAPVSSSLSSSRSP